MTSLMSETRERAKIRFFGHIGSLFSERAQFGFTYLDNGVNTCTQWSCTKEMADICTSIPMALKVNDKTKNGNFEKMDSNMVASETLLSDYEDFIKYAEHSVVVSNGGTDQNKYSPYFKSKTRSMKPILTKRKVRKAIHMVDVAFHFFSSYCSFTSNERRNEFLETCSETLRVICSFFQLLKTIISKAMQEKHTSFNNLVQESK